MRMLVNVICPVEPFNSMVRSGEAGEIIKKIIDDTKPESIYFSEFDGSRGAVMVIDVPNASAVPVIAEPWFLHFEAHCEFRTVYSSTARENTASGLWTLDSARATRRDKCCTDQIPERTQLTMLRTSCLGASRSGSDPLALFRQALGPTTNCRSGLWAGCGRSRE